MVTLDTKGSPLRTVSVCLIKIRKESTGEVLMRLASGVHGSMHVDIVLPGSKLSAGETAHRAAKRIICSELPSSMRRSIVMDRMEQTEQLTTSKKFGIMTMYLKTTVYARLIEDDVRPGRQGLVTANFLSPSATDDALVETKASEKSKASERSDFESMLNTITPFAMPVNDSFHVFAWLTPAQIAKLSAFANDDRCKKWISEVTLPEFWGHDLRTI